MTKKHYTMLALCLTIFVFASAVSADQRSYVWTYEYKTMHRGKAEIEHYLTLSAPDIDKMEGATNTEHNIELEIGMTDHFDFSIYQVFKQDPEKKFTYEGYKLRSRYRLGEKGKFVVDPLVYVEYKGKPDFSKHVIELKLILAKDIGKLNIALNPVLEIEREDDEWESKMEYAAGMSYKLGSLLSVGLEAKGSKDAHYIGPTISHGTEKLWGALGSGFSIGDAKGFKIRMILGIGLN